MEQHGCEINLKLGAQFANNYRGRHRSRLIYSLIAVYIDAHIDEVIQGKQCAED